ncbi:hypothetical protein M1247_21115 [Mycobacterium sp. 21AC1]|uniref:hypothetical protein n=1 Tax=[Mycobacterium] appelbergii TaxID=2939269 RepID=UPI0029391E90|nr:hypothetical protein [Mycobacterium sp. 21AC1]MDV3127439.1 hypothetical protein [Mycobacterium sp. 21AC1]
MTDNTDTATRLAQGKPAVDTIAEYVLACGVLGYHHQDLTRHPGQVHAWYDAEDGLDLRALDAQRAVLGSAAASAEQALQVHDSQLHSLPGVWQGSGAQASHEFLLRHSRSASQAAAALHAAVGTLAELHDNLWRAVDAKVAAAVEIEGRRAGQRGEWLTAARTVTTGLGDRAAASELIDQQVKPFVANDIGGDWLTAMRTTTAEVSDAYDAAIAALRGVPVPVFDIPGDLGPVWTPGPGATPASPEGRNSAVTTPAAWSPPSPLPAPAAPPTVPSWPPTVPSWPAPVSPAGYPAPSVEPLMPAAAPVGAAPEVAAPPADFGQGSALGGGSPGVGSGVTGFGQQLADLFGGLIGSAADGLPEADALTEIDDPLADEAADEILDDGDDDPDESETAEESDEAELDEPELDEDEPVDADSAAEPEEQQPISPEPPDPEPAQPPPAPMAGQMAEPLAAPPGGTPCDIAADELPQVGG